MSECMTQEDAMNMSNEQAVAILKPLMNMMRDQYGCPISDAYFALDKAITALLQPQRMKGRWIHDGCDIPHGVDWMHCSVCGRREPHVPAAITNFCPTCGSDMRGEDDAFD